MSGETSKQDTILIVDDTSTNLDLLFKYLSRSGFRVLVAQNGEMALLQAEQARPDIILLDVMMPEMDGFETCRHLKAKDSTKDIPVIFMTALSDVNNKVEGFNVGAIDYVTKPFERREVLARLNTHLTLRKLQTNLQAEIGERERTEEILRQNTVELQARNEELDAFAHTVAHNLKNPLNALTGIAQLLALDYDTMSREDMKKYLDIIHQGGRKASNIIEELLILASVRKKEIVPEPMDMAQIVHEATRRVTNLLDKEQPNIIMPKQWPTAIGHGPWVEEIWVNYMNNAIKYGGDPPRLELGATVEPKKTIRFWVKDNGPGLSPEEQDRLFTPFTQLGKAKVQGHGLGLSIVRHIAEKLDGSVAVESSGLPGQGCTFSFTLPAA